MFERFRKNPRGDALPWISHETREQRIAQAYRDEQLFCDWLAASDSFSSGELSRWIEEGRDVYVRGDISGFFSPMISRDRRLKLAQVVVAHYPRIKGVDLNIGFNRE